MDKIKLLFRNPKLFFKKVYNKLTGSSQPTLMASNFDPFDNHTHLLYSGEGEGGLSHLRLWIPHFLKAGVRFAVMVRNYELYRSLVELYPDLSILYGKNEKNVRFFLKRLVFLKACFYPSNTGNNLHLLKHTDVNHIFIGHGDSDKSGSAHKYFRVYDENWVAGEAHVDRFRNEGFDFRGLKFVKVGRPNLKELLQLSQKPWRERFEGKLKLLYLTTWEGVFKEQDYTSAYIMKDILKNVEDMGIFDEIAVKLHPWTGRRNPDLVSLPKELEALAEKFDTKMVLYSPDVALEEAIKEANVFICDISAVVSEVLAANSPIFLYYPKGKKIRLAKSKMDYDDYCYLFSNEEELMKKLRNVIVHGSDSLLPARERAMEYILGKEETLKENFVNHLREIGSSNGHRQI